MEKRLKNITVIITSMIIIFSSCDDEPSTSNSTNGKTNPGSNTHYKTMIDQDSNVYNIASIDTLTWMAENLRTTKFRDGTTIPLETNDTLWPKLTTPGYCWYNNDSSTYAQTYGALYNWYTVETGNLCPTGWHVPTFKEWNTLVIYLGDNAGAYLKGTSHWKNPDTGPTNITGFTALPGGYRSEAFYGTGYGGFWWSTTEEDYSTGVRYWTMSYNSSYLMWSGMGKQMGLSIRCVEDY